MRKSVSPGTSPDWKTSSPITVANGWGACFAYMLISHGCSGPTTGQDTVYQKCILDWKRQIYNSVISWINIVFNKCFISPDWKTSSLPPAPVASRFTNARTSFAQGCCVMNPWLASTITTFTHNITLPLFCTQLTLYNDTDNMNLLSECIM